MPQRPRIHYTESRKALMRERWQKGESLQQIAQLFDRNHSSIQAIVNDPRRAVEARPLANDRNRSVSFGRC